MNASKENAAKAEGYFNQKSHPEFIREFLDAARRKLPSEAAYEREKAKRKQSQPA